MSLSETTNGNGLVMPVSPMNGNGYGYGGDGAFWIIILFLFAFMGNGWGGYGGNGQTQADVQRGFDQSAVMSGINTLNSTVANGFANAEVSRCNSQTNLLQTLNNMAMNFQNCCCENKAQIADVKYTIATEACADRASVNNALRDVIASNTANTQAILDKMCQQEMEAYKRENENLRNMINMQNLAASQTAQTAQLIADNTAQTQYIVNRVAPYPVPAYTVPNPFGTTTTTAG